MPKQVFLAIFIVLTGCLKQSYAPAERQSESATQDLGFVGVETVADITERSATISWSDGGGSVVGYRIYFEVFGSYVLNTTVYNTTEYTFTDLSANTSYTVMVNSFDVDDDEYDTDSVTFSTNVLPDAPSSFSIVAPSKTPYYLRRPTILVEGVKSGNTIELYDNSSCSTGIGDGKIASGVAISDTIELTVDVDLTAGSLYIYGKSINPFATPLESSCSSTYLYYPLNECPSGYTYVNENVALSTDGFCMMRYEARAWIDSDDDRVVDSNETIDSDGCLESGCTTQNWGAGTYLPAATINYKPWRMMSFRAARNACLALGTGFDIISNNEWMTAAREIEANSVNWSGSGVGSGCIKAGNTGEDSDCSYYAGSITAGTTNITKRGLALTSNAYIYDFSGNLAEWVGWYIPTGLETKIVTCNQPLSEIPDFACVDFASEEYAPTDASYNSDQYVGKINAITSGYGIRGGSMSSLSLAGIYSLNFSPSDSYVPGNIGFRCVYRP